MWMNLKDYLQSWSTWILALVTVTPVLNDSTGVIAQVIPDKYMGITVTCLGILGLIARGIKQVDALKIKHK